MRTIKLIVLFTVVFCLNGFSQTKFPIKFRAEKQAMSTPMTLMEDVIFTNYYYAKPVNIKFDESLLNMCYDDGSTFIKKNVTEVKHDKEYDDGSLMLETFQYTDNNNTSDTISYVIDYLAEYIQIVLPTTNSEGKYIGYTAYRKFITDGELALK